MMIDVVTTRRTTLGDVTYEKGAPLQMPLQQFQDLEPGGQFARAKSEKKTAGTAE